VGVRFRISLMRFVLIRLVLVLVVVWENVWMGREGFDDVVRGDWVLPVESKRDWSGRSVEWVDVAVGMFLEGDGPEVKGMSYTKPELRERLKRRIMAGSKGGRAGQWSARKAQLLAQAYRKAGGGYRGGKSKRQRSLSKWTREDWTTSDGKPAKRRDRKGRTVMSRYLPKEAWSRLSTGERRATNAKKRKASRDGRQFVSNTRRARDAGRDARKTGDDLVDGVSGGRREPITGDEKPKRPKGNHL